MDKIIKQTITTNESTTTSEKISVLVSTLESQIIDEGVPGLNESKFTSSWSEEEQHQIKQKILGLIKDF